MKCTPRNNFSSIHCPAIDEDPRIIPKLFHDCMMCENIYLPAEFWDMMGLKMNF